MSVDQTKNVMITGGVHISWELTSLASLIGYETILGGYRLYSNGTEGVDTCSAYGALMACLLNDYNPNEWISVFRPVSGSAPEFNFGHFQTAGENYAERRNYVISHSDAVVIVGGGKGTEEVTDLAMYYQKSMIPVGIGPPGQAAVSAWQHWYRDVESGVNTDISLEMVQRIGPDQGDLRSAALGVVDILDFWLEQD